MAKKKEYTLEAVNDRLKASQLGVVVLQRGNRLSLRATLPPKPGSGKTKNNQQILSLGIHATPAGFEAAEAKAHEISSQLTMGRFDWGQWIAIEGKDTSSCRHWIEKLKTQVLATLEGLSPEEAELVWRWEYYTYYKRLPLDSPITAEAIIKAVKKTAAGTSSRKACCHRMKKLVTIAGIDVDLSEYVGSYSGKKAKRRKLPTDQHIEEAVSAIKNPQWKWVIAMISTYGLRSHEVFSCKLEWKEIKWQGRDRVLVAKVQNKTKTGWRDVFPLYPHWVELWDLASVKMPEINVRLRKEYGGRVAEHLREREIPLTAYNLRHAYGVRGTVKLKIPVPVMASMMGHSPEIHLSTYQRWASEEQHVEAWAMAIAQIQQSQSP